MSYFISAFRMLFKKAGAAVGTRQAANYVDTATVSWTLTDDPANDQVSIQATASASGGPTPATTVTDETTFGVAKTVGSLASYAREDHTHGSEPHDAHASLTGTTPNDHHAQAHSISGADHTGTLAHSATSGKTADDHHNQAHALSGADHSGAISAAQHPSIVTGDLHPEYATDTDLATHTALTGTHHAEIHALYGADHTGSLDSSQHPVITSGNHHPEYELNPEVEFFFQAMKETGGLEFMMEAFS